MNSCKKIYLYFSFLLLSSFSMAQSNNTVTIDFLQSFVEAFNAHDVDAIMKHMTADCVFNASAGPDVEGETFTGQEAVGKAFEDVFATFPDGQWNQPIHFIFGDRGVSEWIFTGTKKDGTRVEVTGCDLWTFSAGRISVKNSYRKNRIANSK